MAYAYKFVPLDSEEDTKPFRFVSLEDDDTIERENRSLAGRYPAPAPAPARVSAPAVAAPIDYTDAMGSMVSGGRTPDYEAPAPTVGTRSFLDKPAERPFSMLRPEYVTEVRDSFADLPPEQRRDALVELAQGTDARAKAAQQILASVLGEDKARATPALFNKKTIDFLAKAPPGQATPGPKQQAPLDVSFPDVSPTIFDSLDNKPEADRVKEALRRDEITRKVVPTTIERLNNPDLIRGVTEAKAEEFRSAGEWAADTLSSIGQGAVSLVQLPTALFAPGSSLAVSLRKAQEELQGQESDVLKAQRSVMLDRVLHEDGFFSKYYESLKELTTNPALALSEVAKQVPNFLAIMGVARAVSGLAGVGVSALEKASPTFALANAIGGGAIRTGVTATAATAGGFTANAILTTGDAAESAYTRLVDPKQTPLELWKKNPDYQKLLDEGKTSEEAIVEIATAKSRIAAVLAAPLALFGFAGAEAAMVSRAAGQGLASIATPKGAAKLFAKEIIGNTIEEGGTQAAGNFAIRLVDQSQKLLEGVPEAMATATVTSGPFAARAVQAQVQDAFRAPPVDQEAQAYARRALDVQSYDANIITPQQQAQIRKDQEDLQKSTSAADVAAAADNLSGSLPELLVPANRVTPLPPKIEPVAELPARIEPTIPEVAAGINPEVEQQFGLDKLRLNAPRPQRIQGEPVASLTDDKLAEVVDDESAHPMTRRGAAIELTARRAEQAPTTAITPTTATGAYVQQAAPQQAVMPQTAQIAIESRVYTPGELGKLSLGQRRDLSKTFDQSENEDGTITFTAKPGIPPAASAPPVAGAATNFGLGAAEGRVSNAPVTATGDAARADLQTRLDEAAAKYGITVPALTAPAKSDEAAVNVIAEALGHTGKVVAYADANGADGFELGGKIAINTKTQKGVAATAFHENHHIIERLAEADTQAGRVNTPAQQYVVSVNGLFDDMTPEGKRSYVENFIHKDELASIADPVAREQRTQELLSAPMLRSEMSADFMGNRATDRPFLADLAQADPKGFGGFVQKWIGILDNMLVRLRGVKGAARDNLESIKVDQYLNDLNQAKMVARDAMVAFRNGTLQQSAPATTPLAFSQQQGESNAQTGILTGTENLPGPPEAGGRSLGTDRSDQTTPSYGTAREGAVSVLARHYSTTPRQTLSGTYYGRGLKGAERTRLDSSADPRLKSRVYFYVDEGSGIRPESGVGGVAHETQLTNIYDPKTQLIKPQPDANAFESAVINAGFDGYIAPFGNNQSAVVLLGQKHKAVPVRNLGNVASAGAPVEALPTVLKKGLMSSELGAIDTSNIPGARVRSGTLEIPTEQRDAANAELTRIGSTIQFSGKEIEAPARVMFEVAPDPNNAPLKARWDAVPFDRKIEISQRVAEQVMPKVFKLAGVQAELAPQLGGYLDDTSPSFAAVVPSSASADQLIEVAHLGGFGLAQDSMMVLGLKPFTGSEPTSLITVGLPEDMTGQAQVHSVYQALRKLSPENISGHTTVGREMVLAVASNTLDELMPKIQGALNARPESFTLKSDEGHMAFPSKEDYDYGNAGREGAPNLFAKRQEASDLRQEASAAIERELGSAEAGYQGALGSEVAFSPRQDGYRDVAKNLNLSDSEYNATALGLMTGKTKADTFAAPKVGGLPEVVQWLSKRHDESGKPRLDISKPGDRTVLAKLMASEAVAAIHSSGDAVEWYDETIDKALRTMAVKHPELDTDPHARNAFLVAVAIASQTMNVEDNLKYASRQYAAFRQTGKFPELGSGKSSPAMAKNFALANSLLADMGPDLFRRFLQTEVTKKDLESLGYKISGESMSEKMLGSAVFGPKIGFGFYSNLTGNFEPVTMDMWFMRTVGRLAGTLPAFDQKLFSTQVAKLRTALATKGDSSVGLYAADFDPAAVAAAQQSDEGAIALARQVYSLHNRQFIKERAAFDSGKRVKTPLVSAATSILKSVDKPTDSPKSGGERQHLRDVVRQMVDLVEQQTGKRVPAAALQALIWYPEQELYKKLGVKLRVTSQDYAGAAKSLLTKEGFDGKRLLAATESRPGSARPVAGGPVEGTANAPGDANFGAGPLVGKERAAFLRTRTDRQLAQESLSQKTEDIFAGLDKRGLAKTRAEIAFTARPDGAQIKYVQENFHDILIQLEDADKVKINCD